MSPCLKVLRASERVNAMIDTIELMESTAWQGNGCGLWQQRR